MTKKCIPGQGDYGRPGMEEWHPRKDESVDDFVKRASQKDPCFNFNQWKNTMEQKMRQAYPSDFTGPGW